MRRPRILYISYDGMLEPLGQSQVIAYLERLSSAHEIHLLSFEKPSDQAQAEKVSHIRTRLEKARIVWHPLTYHKSPSVPATLFDIAQGAVVATYLVARHRVGLIHARSYVAALVAWMAKLATGTRMLFDMRGLWADERTDGGIWPAGGRIYRAVKRIEKTLLLGADHIVTLTAASKVVLENFPYLVGTNHAPITVIPTCADLDRFAPDKTPKPSDFTLGYLGSIGTWYMFDEVLECFKILLKARPSARLLVVNRNEQELVRHMVSEAGIPSTRVEITSADHADVPAQIRRMSAGAAIIRPVYSKIASAPTKLAEYLGCGVPCLGNVGVGDMELILEGEGAGVALREFSATERHRAVEGLLKLTERRNIAAHCRQVAERHFSVEDGAARYAEIYRELLA